MADYTFESTLAADPFSFQRAANADMAVYDAADESNTTLLALKDLNGLPIPNPLKTSADGFAPAFVAPVAQVKLVGGGLAVVVASFQGVRDEAVAAKLAADESKLAAQSAANAAAATVTDALEEALTATDEARAAAVAAAGLVGAPADNAIAAAIGATGSATKTALNATIGDQILADATDPEGIIPATIDRATAPSTVLSEAVGKIKAGQADVSILIVSDSTAAMTTPNVSWANQLPGKLAELYPSRKVSYRLWDQTANAYGAEQVFNAGGAPTLRIWNGGASSRSWDYQLDTRRSASLITATSPDAILVSHGHNDFGASIAAADWYKLRDRALGSIEQIRVLVPNAAILLMSQNPQTVNPGLSEKRADMYRALARERGYGFLDIAQAFHDDGRPMSDLVRVAEGDGIHPTAAGFTIWLGEVLRLFDRRPTSQALSSRTPSLLERTDNILPSIAASGFTLSNAVASDATDLFETGTSSLKIVKTAAGGAGEAMIALDVNKVKGRTITIAARVYVPEALKSTGGLLRFQDGVTTARNDIGWNYIADQWQWKILTVKVADSAAYARLYIIGDSSFNEPNTFGIRVDRVIVSEGRDPFGYAKETPTASGSSVTEVVLTPNMFSISADGGQTPSIVKGLPVWNFPNGASQAHITTLLKLPADWNTFNVYAQWLNPGAATGTARIRYIEHYVAPGDTVVDPVTAIEVGAVAQAQNVLVETLIASGRAVSAGKYLEAGLGRAPHNAADTFESPLSGVALVLRKAS